jgi:hypothetical protein
MTPQVQPSVVRAAIASYAANAPESEELLAALSQCLVLLPLYLDWTAFIGLAPTGELVLAEYEAPFATKNAEVAEAGRWKAGIRHLAFAAGFIRYPHLTWLQPVRTSDAVVCTTCSGTGRPSFGGEPAPENVLCECGGMGWLPPSDA